MDSDEGAIKLAKSKYKNVDVVLSIFTMQMIWVSESFAKKMGYSKNELQGQSVRSIISLSSKSMLKILTNMFGSDGTDRQIVKTKTGELMNAVGKSYSFVYEKEPHIVIADVKLEPVEKSSPS